MWPVRAGVAVHSAISVADPGFPRGVPGAPIYYLTNFSLKLHEDEEILARGEGASHVLP